MFLFLQSLVKYPSIKYIFFYFMLIMSEIPLFTCLSASGWISIYVEIQIKDEMKTRKKFYSVTTFQNILPSTRNEECHLESVLVAGNMKLIHGLHVTCRSHDKQYWSSHLCLPEKVRKIELNINAHWLPYIYMSTVGHATYPLLIMSCNQI